MDSVGYHELIVTRDHRRQIAELDKYNVAEIIDAYQDRYIELMNKKSVNYIEIFHNHGKEAGASIVHPHSQLVAIPVISPYIKGELDGAENYWRGNKHCVYCAMVEWELEHRKRIVFENDSFVVFCPFASRVAFEMWVMPKKHKPYFERTSVKDKLMAGEALQVAIGKVFHALNDPAYNFYIHTSPCDGRDYPHYHWHIEILPRMSIWAGLEYSTGIEISTIEPEESTEYLRNI
jgi:UDPglucose--hexose-1-phosphate uridylyltransferase